MYFTLGTNVDMKGIAMAGTKGQWFISDDTKKECITALVSELKVLRAKANISQDDLAKILSISRQTYCQIENGNKDMSWNIYLSLIFFFESLEETSKLISLFGIYPEEFVRQFKVNSQDKL